MRNKIENLNMKLKKDYFSNKIASFTRNRKESWKTINQPLNRKSERYINNVKVEGRDIKHPLKIAQAMNDYFCSVGKNLCDKIEPQPNLLLSNENTIVEHATG